MLSTLRRVNSPEPRTTPRCSTPIATSGIHLVIDMASTRRIGPTRVQQSNVVPTPARCGDRKMIDSASAIHMTCEPMSSIALHVVAGDASITVATRIVVLTSPNHPTRTLWYEDQFQRSQTPGMVAGARSS